MVSIYWFRFWKLFPEIFHEPLLTKNLSGMNKMVINHLEKLFVTSDAHTIINESDINHPAARMIAQAAKMQQNECGDNTNLVLTLCGELMS
jgi:T-complex protein 1 subunit theta